MNLSQLVAACYHFALFQPHLDEEFHIDNEEVVGKDFFCHIGKSTQFLFVRPELLPEDPNIRALAIVFVGGEARVELETTALNWRDVQDRFKRHAPECRDMELDGRTFYFKGKKVLRSMTRREHRYLKDGRIVCRKSPRTLFLSIDPLSQDEMDGARYVADFVWGYDLWDEEAAAHLPSTDGPVTTIGMRQEQSQQLRQLQQTVLLQQQVPMYMMCMQIGMRTTARRALRAEVLRASGSELPKVVRRLAAGNPTIEFG